MGRRTGLLLLGVVAILVAILVIGAVYEVSVLRGEPSSWTPSAVAQVQPEASLSSAAPQSSIPWTSHPESSCADRTQYNFFSSSTPPAPNVCNLRIETSTLGALPLTTFQFTNLNSLIVITNDLASVPSQIGSLIGLQRLYIWSFRDFTSGGVLFSPDKGAVVRSGYYVFKRNPFTNLPPEIGDLTNLTDLEIMGSGLKEIPPEIDNLRKLQTLYIDDANIATVPSALGDLTDLSSLGLGQNAITELPDAIYRLPKLSNLYLPDNGISSLSPAIGQLHSLTSIDLTDNDLTSLPKEIGNLKGLTFLSLHGNRITSLPDEIGNLSSLQNLVVSFNQLKEIPDSVGNLTNLTSLSVSYNDLTSLPASVANLKGLKTLYMFGNHFSPQEIEKIRSLVPHAKIYTGAR